MPYGSDYLLGLATFAPERFAERDRLWETGDPLTSLCPAHCKQLGFVAFRPPVPAYKHSAAIFLNITGRIPSAKAHVQNPTRPAWEPELMRECAQRLKLD